VPACPPRVKANLLLNRDGRCLDPRRTREFLLFIAGMSLSAHPRENSPSASPITTWPLRRRNVCTHGATFAPLTNLLRPYFRFRHCCREHTRSPENLKCEEPMPMQNNLPTKPPSLQRLRAHARRLTIPSLMFLAALPVYAQSTSDPWDNAVTVLKTAFTGTIATGLSLVAIVVGGLMFAYGEGQSKKTLAGIVFGVGMAVGAVNFMAWLFPS
jgi:type IV secretory pathway VirB2 component (pilin)